MVVAVAKPKTTKEEVNNRCNNNNRLQLKDKSLLKNNMPNKRYKSNHAKDST